MKRRLDKLEGSLGPKETVLHWLAEAHAAGSLPAYVGSLIDGPDSAQPFIALPRTVADGVWQRMRGEPKAAIKFAGDEAVADTVFLLQLVVGLNVHVEGIVRTESLRHAALYWWRLAVDPDRRGKVKLPPEWHAGVTTLVGMVVGTEDARRAAEIRYLDGHDVLFPALATRWEELHLVAEALGGADEEVAAVAEQAVTRVVRMARADGLDAARQHRAADAMAERVAATVDGDVADG